METVSDLVSILKHGINQARRAEELWNSGNHNLSLDTFKRRLRDLSSEARKLGHRVIGDNNGYYIALTEKEWRDYCHRRFAAIKDELVSLAKPEGIAVKDLIKLVYKVDVFDNNLSLDL